ncbi:organic cation transporter protein-like isoform X3 [Lineus longissimus]|uniref:organic cation transporter protein-like isoform X3 n=1 Tax=Lineus longissimus TaxID=88925 RepID=UPI00315DEA5A
MDLDETIEHTGAFGRYQVYIFLIFAVTVSVDAMMALDAVFILGLPEYRCSVPGYANDTFEIQGDAHQALINASIPEGESCTTYDTAQNGSLLQQKCSQWVYDDTFYSPSVISEFDIVCDKVILRSVTNMLFMFFKILGGIVGGQISDRFGRKKVFCFSLLLMSLSKLASGFAPEIYSLMIFRGFSSCFSVAFYQTGFVWAMEFVGSSKRQIAGMASNFFFAFGVCLVTPLAYFIRNWRHLTFAITGPCVFFFGYWWLIEESPRWLITNGRRKEAEDIIRKVAKFNGKSDALPAGPLFEGTKDKEDQEVVPEKTVNCCTIMKNKTLAVRLICLSINWAAVSAAYYGLSLNSGNLSGDIYINYLVTGLIEIPAYIYALFAPMKFGRKYTHAFAMIVGGTACIVSIFPVIFGGSSLSWLITTLSTIGKFGASASFASVYIWTAEMTPTSMRVVTLGITSTAARVASMIAPYITDLGMLIVGPFSKALPLIILGAFGLLAGIFSFTLPETLGRPLPETIEDALLLGRAPKISTEDANQTELEQLNGKQSNGSAVKA